MENNKKIEQRRLAQVKKRLLSSSNQLMQNYDAAIREYLLSGVAEKVTELMDTVESPRHMYYTPHHAVIREDRVTTKIRIVFDASSHEVHTKSLNDNLDSGPNLNPDIMTVLLKFRLYPVALVTDAQKAFLQIMIREEDRDALRFLWYETEPEEGKPLPKIVAWRMNRVTFETAPSTFLLAATLHHHLRLTAKEYPETVGILGQSVYVDDVILGAQNVEEAEKRYMETKQIFSKASMKLQKWGSNCNKMRRHIP
ncbi:uncharacterized protein LOC135389533 [Ornithodoros turicata]|uniref:uncharacterized protein LOC135389533 n=1 Tax=Ornithodoros turicata TaxID=34597 RepID=UPI003138D3A5